MPLSFAEDFNVDVAVGVSSDRLEDVISERDTLEQTLNDFKVIFQKTRISFERSKLERMS